VIYGELGFAAELARGVFCLSRAVGILSHAWEQRGRHERNKGPMPRQLPYRYTGAPERHLGDLADTEAATGGATDDPLRNV
jgi:citrate synthase